MKKVITYGHKGEELRLLKAIPENIILEVDRDVLINQPNTRTIGFTRANDYIQYKLLFTRQ